LLEHRALGYIPFGKGLSGVALLVFSRLLDMLLGYFLATSLHSIFIIYQMTSVIIHTAEIPSNVAWSLLANRQEEKGVRKFRRSLWQECTKCSKLRHCVVWYVVSNVSESPVLILLRLENGGGRFLPKIGNRLQSYVASHSTRPHTTFTQLWGKKKLKTHISIF